MNTPDSVTKFEFERSNTLVKINMFFFSEMTHSCKNRSTDQCHMFKKCSPPLSQCINERGSEIGERN